MKKYTMIKSTFVMLFVVLLLQTTFAKTKVFPKLPSADSTAQIQFVRTGDSIIIMADSILLYDRNAQKLMAAKIKKCDSIDVLVGEQIETTEPLVDKYHQLITHYDRIDSLQNKTFDSLKILNSHTDLLLTRSIALTDRAVRQSYFTSIVLGGIAGYSIPRDQDILVNCISAAAGMLAGLVINHFIMR